MKTVLFLVTLLAQQQQQQMKPPTAEEIAAMQAQAMPGPEHKLLEQLAGTWTLDGAFNMGGPQVAFTGRANNRLVLGGRFLVSEFDTKAPTPGFSIEGMSIYGFDRRTDEFTIVGYDSMGTYYVTGAGKKAAASKEVSMRGEVAEHGGTKQYDMVLRWIDRDTYVSEVIFHFPQGPMKIVEVTHKRIK